MFLIPITFCQGTVGHFRFNSGEMFLTASPMIANRRMTASYFSGEEKNSSLVSRFT